MPNYPESIYSPRTKANRSGVEYLPEKESVIFAEDVQKLDDEIVAVETDLLASTRIRAYHGGGNQTIAHATTTKIQLNAKDYDAQNEFDEVTNYRFTATKAGYYLMFANVQWSTAVDQCSLITYIYKNNAIASLGLSKASGAAGQRSFVSDILYLVPGDFVDMRVYQNSGGDLDVVDLSSRTYLTIFKLPG